MKQLEPPKHQGRHGSFSCCHRHRRTLRMSILLLQLLCLPLCCVPMDVLPTMGGEVDIQKTEPADSLDASHRNLRETRSSRMGRLSSLTGALYSLLGITDWYEDEALSIKTEDGASSSAFDTETSETPVQVESLEDLADNHDLSGEARRLASRTTNMLWYVDWVNAQCVQSCDPRTTTNPNCAGLALRENFLFQDAGRCCKTMIPWKSWDACTRVGSPDGTLNQVYEDINIPVNNWGNVMAQPPVSNVKPPSKLKPLETMTSTTTTSPPRPQKSEIVVKSSCWRSGMSCATEAQKFACCGKCSNGVCI